MCPAVKSSPKLLVIDDFETSRGNIPTTLSVGLAIAASVYAAFFVSSANQLVYRLLLDSPSQLELLRHCFQYNDSCTFYRRKLSIADIQDLV